MPRDNTKLLERLDEVARVLAPGFDPDDAVREHSRTIMRRELMTSMTSAGTMSGVLEMKEFVEQLPARLNRIADQVASGEFTVNVESFDEERLLGGLHRVANRVAAGVVIAALVLGTSMLARIDGVPTLFGYPALATIFFLVAAALAVALALTAPFRDPRA